MRGRKYFNPNLLWSLAVVVWLLPQFSGADVRWEVNGVTVCALSGNQENPKIVSDGSGGAVIAWDDKRGADYDIYVKRIKSDGKLETSGSWGNSTGVPVCRMTGDDVGPTLIRSRNGASDDGYILVWHHLKTPGTEDWDLYAQKLNNNGDSQWTYDGVTICALPGDVPGTNPGAQLISHIDYDTSTGHFYVTGEGFRVVSDNNGGAVVAWEDYREAVWDTVTPPAHYKYIDIYGQRLDASGVLQWPGGTSGLAIQAADGLDHGNVTLCPLNSSGDVMATWEDNRNMGGSDVDIFARRINANGNLPWAPMAVTVCAAPYQQWSPVIATDTAGGGIIVWRDNRNTATTGWDIYAQRVNGSTGAVQWTADGVPVCRAVGDQTDKFVISDDAGGVITAWVDLRNDATNGWDLYAQRLNQADGSPHWTLDGVPVCTAPGNQCDLQLYPDLTQGLLVVWEDYRDSTPGQAPDIYAQRIGTDGRFKWALNGEQVCTALGEQSYPFINNGPFNSAIIAWQDKRGADYDVYAQSVNTPPWDVSTITPNSAICGTAISVTITGTEFLTHPLDRVFLNKSGYPQITGTNLHVQSETVLWCDFPLTWAVGGLWNVSVAQGNTTSTLANGLAVHVRLDQFQPVQAVSGSTFAGIVSGLGFSTGTTFQLFSGAAQLVAQQILETTTRLQGQIVSTGSEQGRWDLAVVDADGVNTTRSQVLQWITPTPTATVPPVTGSGEWSFYPNPVSASKLVNVVANPPESGRMRLQLYNLSGERVLRWETAVVSGLQVFSLDVKNLAKGVYLARAEFIGVTRSQKWKAKKLAVIR